MQNQMAQQAYAYPQQMMQPEDQFEQYQEEALPGQMSPPSQMTSLINHMNVPEGVHQMEQEAPEDEYDYNQYNEMAMNSSKEQYQLQHIGSMD